MAPPKIGGGSSENRGSQLPVKQGHPATEHAPHQTATRGGSQLVPPGIEPARRRKKGRADLTVRIPSRIQEAGHVTLTGRAKKLCTLLDLCVSSLRRGHANLLCIVPILTDDLRRGSNPGMSNAFGCHLREASSNRCGLIHLWDVKCIWLSPARNLVKPMWVVAQARKWIATPRQIPTQCTDPP